MSVLPRMYGEYSAPDGGRGIYKKIPSQYPARSLRRQKNSFFSACQGIYRKIVPPDPLFCHQRGTHTKFFCIYPASPHKLSKKGAPAKQQGTAKQFFYIYPVGANDDQNMPACADQARMLLRRAARGVRNKPLLHTPRKSLPDRDSFHQQVRGWTIRRNADTGYTDQISQAVCSYSAKNSRMEDRAAQTKRPLIPAPQWQAF